MKKVLSIFLLILYTASFSGMIWPSDCKQGAVNINISEEIYLTCNKNKGHANDNASHPLNQFCKLIEVHKEILVAGPQKAFTNYDATRQTCSNITIFSAPLQYSFNSFTYPGIPPKLFLRNRVLLI